MAEDMSAAVLGREIAEVGTKAHVGDGGFVRAPFVNGEAFEEDEAFAVEDVGAGGGEEVGEAREGE